MAKFALFVLFFFLLCTLPDQQILTFGVGSSHIQWSPAEGIIVMQTVAEATLQFIFHSRKPPPTYTQSLMAPIMETNMETQILGASTETLGLE